MSFSPHPERFALPVLDAPAARAPFPLVATIAPVGIAVAVWAVTGSPFALLFALLGPVVAVAGLFDSRLHAKRGRRRAGEQALAAVAALGDRVAARQERERGRLHALAPTVDQLADAALAPAVGDRPIPVRIGSGDLPDPVEFDGTDPSGSPPALLDAVGRLREGAGHLVDAPVIVDARDGIGVVGPPLAARALARSLELQLRARLVPSDSVVVAWADQAEAIPARCGVVVRVDGHGPRIERPRPLTDIARFRPEFACGAQERRLVSMGAADGRAEMSALPEQVGLAELLAAAATHTASGSAPGLAAPIGRDAVGTVWLDLVAQGPHALIAGTTGSGKSELLVAWVVALATLHPPSRVTFLLVDFKGGAAFAPLSGVPHVIGTLSDLDGRLAARAVESLRAELRRRERLLAERAARSIDELPSGVLARLVIVIDEFAAVVAEHPELQPVFADLAARGRSLGLHLVLCTQRPSGVVRDAVLANITLRVSLRVTDRADSIAVIGSDAASALPVEPPGRAIVVDGSVAGLVQLALAGPDEVAALRAESTGGVDVIRPWCDPLPDRIELSSVPEVRSGYAFGLVDLPAEQRQPPAVHSPERHGALLVLGATGSGKTTALATLAARAGGRALRLPPAPADAWQVMTELVATPQTIRAEAPRLVIADDLDVLLGGFGADHRAEAVDLVTRLAREGSSTGIALVASAQSLATTMQAVAGAFGSRLLLRLGSREEHVLAGGEGARFDPGAAPGSGSWRGSVVQVAIGVDDGGTVADEPPTVPVIEFSPTVPIGIVCGRPRELRGRLIAAGVRVIDLGETVAGQGDGLTITLGDAPIALLGDPDAWHAEWALLGRARREWPIVLTGCTIADHRALTRSGELPPPLGSRPGECWLVREGVTARAVLATSKATDAN